MTTKKSSSKPSHSKSQSTKGAAKSAAKQANLGAKGTNRPRPAAAPRVANNAGQPAMLALWLLLSSNPQFLVNPSAASRKTGVVPDTPLPLNKGNGAKDQTVSDLCTTLNTANNNFSANFNTKALNTILVQKLATPIPAANKLTGATYADVLVLASTVFNDVAGSLIQWTPPCPGAAKEITGAMNL